MGGHAAGGDAKYPVAGFVAVAVVDVLEVIKVDDQYGKVAAMTFPAMYRLPHAIRQQMPVGQSGQGIVHRLMFGTLVFFSRRVHGADLLVNIDTGEDENDADADHDLDEAAVRDVLPPQLPRHAELQGLSKAAGTDGAGKFGQHEGAYALRAFTGFRDQDFVGDAADVADA